MDYAKKSLELHYELKGKIEVASRTKANPAPAPKSGFSSRYILSWKLRLMTSSWCSRLNLVKFTA